MLPLEPWVAQNIGNGYKHNGRRWVAHYDAASPGAYAFPLHDCRERVQPRRRDGMSDYYDDPFANHEKRPALSFKGAPVGATVTCVVDAHPKLVQQRDFTTGTPATWPDGNPKMAAVIDVTVNGQAMSVWASKPSSLFTAIAEAQDRAGTRIAPGGTLVIRFVGEKPNEKDPRLNPQKLYEAQYAPGSVFDTPSTPAPVAQPVAPPPSTTWATTAPVTAPQPPAPQPVGSGSLAPFWMQ